MRTFKNEMKQIKWTKPKDIVKQTLFVSAVSVVIATGFAFFDAGVQALIGMLL